MIVVNLKFHHRAQDCNYILYRNIIHHSVFALFCKMNVTMFLLSFGNVPTVWYFSHFRIFIINYIAALWFCIALQNEDYNFVYCFLEML